MIMTNVQKMYVTHMMVAVPTLKSLALQLMNAMMHIVLRMKDAYKKILVTDVNILINVTLTPVILTLVVRQQL
jgi:hypothetical protein